MKRSGSTWSFNVCRILNQLKAQQLNHSYESYFRDKESLEKQLEIIAQSNNQTHYTIKTHIFTQNVIDMLIANDFYNVCTIRDPRDCVTSEFLFHEQPLEKAVIKTLHSLSHVAAFVQIGKVLFIRYEQMMQDPKKYIKQIADYLNISCDEKVIEHIHAQTNIEASKQISENITNQPAETYHQEQGDYVDQTTYLHTGHVQGGHIGRWQNDLNPEQQRYVNDKLQPWLVLMGYSD